MRTVEGRLAKQLNESMRSRYEKEVDEKRKHHEEMKRLIADRLTQKHKILCIETQPGGGMSARPQFEALNPERRRMYWEAATGGSEETGYAPMFRYVAGYEPGDDRFEVWRAADGEARPPSDLEEYDGVFVTGSSSMVKPGEPWMNTLYQVSRELRDGRNPQVFATCFGHQAFAFAEGGDVDYLTVENAAGETIRYRQFGPTKLLLTEEALKDPLFKGVPQEFWIQSSRSQGVTRFPVGAIPYALNPVDRSQILRLSDRRRTIQHHPEMDAITIDIILDMREDDIREELAHLPEEMKRRIGFSSIRELRQNLATIDTHEIRTYLYPNFMELVERSLRKK